MGKFGCVRAIFSGGERLKLIICLTAGGNPTVGGWRPDAAGLARLRTLERVYDQGDLVGICGGYPNHHGHSLAERMAVEICTRPGYSGLRAGLRWVSGSTNNSVHDLGGLDQMVPAEQHVDELVISSNPFHLSRIRPTLEYYILCGCKIRHLNSGEESNESSILSRVVRAYTALDPTWSWRLGRRLASHADQLALRHREECERWAEAHPSEDEDCLGRHREVILTLRKMGVIFAP